MLIKGKYQADQTLIRKVERWAGIPSFLTTFLLQCSKYFEKFISGSIFFCIIRAKEILTNI